MPQSVAEQFKAIPMSSNLAESLERARGFSRAQAHRAVLLEHLLLALIEDPDASGVLRASNIDPVKLGTDVSDYLGRLLEDMRAEPGTEPYADVELHRVLQAAGQAAQQSRRRQIDGAIVLAAIVGDGKSPAAGLLKTLGLSFEEAIKALQKASAQARSKQFATPPKATAPAPAHQSSVAAAEPPTPPGTTNEVEMFSEPMPAQPEQPQTVEEILAAARARIQRRSGTVGGKPEPSAAALEGDLEAAPAPSALAPSALAPRAPPVSDSDDALAALPENMPSPSGPTEPPSPAQSARAGFVPSSPPSGPQLPRSAPPTVAPPEPRAFPNQGHQRQPPPFQGGPALKPGLPTRLPGATRHPLTDGPRSLPNGAGGHHLPSAPSPMGRPAPRPGQRSGAGPLIETIPRRMRVGVPAPAQVRIDREKIEGLILLLLGPRAANLRPDAFLTRALSVRLIAPGGGFWIESEAPETQWVETAPGVQQEESAIWRWNVTPHRRGRYRLLLAVTARAVGRDGLTAEASPPDRTIEVVVKSNARYSIGRAMGLLTAVVAGAGIGRFGPEIWAFSAALIKRLAGG